MLSLLCMSCMVMVLKCHTWVAGNDALVKNFCLSLLLRVLWHEPKDAMLEQGPRHMLATLSLLKVMNTNSIKGFGASASWFSQLLSCGV